MRAANFAAEQHRDQRRKGASAKPFINHPIEVATVLASVGQVHEVVVLAAALLHDTVEDTVTTFDDIEREFGADVRSLVEEMTDDKSLPSRVTKQRQVDHAPHLSTRAKLLKLADKSCNVRDVCLDSPPNWSLERCREYLEWTKRVVDGCRGVNAALERRYDEAYEHGLKVLERRRLAD